MKNTPRSRQANLVVQEMEKELLIYDLTTSKAYCLNETSALVYQLSDGKRTIQEISDLMSVKLETLVSEDFVWLALNELNRDGLIENPDEMKAYLGGISRRELVNKAALASLLVLPVIVSVTSPTAAQSGSTCVPDGGTCIASSRQGNCCQNLYCNPNTTICIRCLPGGSGFVPCDFVGGCQNCDTTSEKDRICCKTGTATNDGTFCYCP